MKQYIEREILSDGWILVILRVGRQYSCYAASPLMAEPPQYFTYRGKLDECRQSFSDVLAQDMCDEGCLC